MSEARRSSAHTFAVFIASAGIALSQTPAPDAESSFNAGLLHLHEGRPELAREQFKNAIKQDPKNPYSQKGLGIACLRLADRCPPRDKVCRESREKEAVEAFRKALAVNPYYVDVRNDLGTALVRLGRRDEGKKQFLTAYNDPTNPTPEMSARNLGQAYFEEKDYPNALSWFRTTVTRNKSYTDGYLGLADTLVATGKLDEAIVELESATKSIPDNPRLQVALGEAYYRAGRFVDARPRLEDAAKRDPGGESGRRAVELLKNVPK